MTLMYYGAPWTMASCVSAAVLIPGMWGFAFPPKDTEVRLLKSLEITFGRTESINVMELKHRVGRYIPPSPCGACEGHGVIPCTFCSKETLFSGACPDCADESLVGCRNRACSMGTVNLPSATRRLARLVTGIVVDMNVIARCTDNLPDEDYAVGVGLSSDRLAPVRLEGPDKDWVMFISPMRPGTAVEDRHLPPWFA